MNIKEYSLKFTPLSCYTLDMVANMRDMIIMVILRVSIKNERAIIFIRDMVIP